MDYQKLFNYLDQELGVIAMETQLSEIKEICSEMIEKEKSVNYGEDNEESEELEPCPTCGDIDGMKNPCCAGYDPLHYLNCGYG